MMRRSRRSSADPWFAIRAVALVALTTLLLLRAAEAPAAPVPLLPDLVPPLPTSPQPAVTTLADGQDHFLLRFDGYIHNIGTGPLEIRGSNPVNGLMTVTGQRIYRDDSSFYDDNSRHPQIQFENADGHDHWHLRNAARFSLWNETGTAEVAVGAKVGFCLQDVDRVDSFAPSGKTYSSAATGYCQQGNPNASRVFEGISSGWQDVYVAKLPFQWVDLSDVAPGRYRLGAQVDPDNFVIESNESNNGPAVASEVVTVPGWVASPGAVTAPGPVTIVLGAQPYGTPGPAALKIESSPKHGKLVPIGGIQYVYAPNAGFAGSDAFTFSARDASSPFPLHSPTATVTVRVPGPAIALRKLRLLSNVRFSRRGRYLTVRANARKTGLLRIRIQKGKRRLGSCTKRARAGHKFRCRIKLRRRASAARGMAVVSLLVNRKPAAVDKFRLPRRLGR
jgi:hypothetical protein